MPIDAPPTDDELLPCPSTYAGMPCVYPAGHPGDHRGQTSESWLNSAERCRSDDDGTVTVDEARQAWGLEYRAAAQRILADAATTIGAGGERHTDYGAAIDNFTDIGKLWAVILDLPEVTAEQVALCMNQVKVARLKHSPNHRDSWVDGCGYLALGGDIAETPGRYL